MPQDRPYSYRFPDGRVKTWPAGTPMEQILEDVRREGGTGQTAPPGQPPPNLSEPRGPAALMQGGKQTINTIMQSLGAPGLPPADPSLLEDSIRAIGQGAQVVSNVSPLGLPLRVLGSAIGGAIEHAPEGDPITGALMAAGLEGMGGVGATAIPKTGFNLGSAMGGVSGRDARRRAVEAHMNEYRRSGPFAGAGERRAIPLGGGRNLPGSVDARAPVRCRIDAQSERLEGIENQITETVPGSMLMGSTNKEVRKRSLRPMSRASTTRKAEEDILTEQAVFENLKEGGKTLTKAAPERLKALKAALEDAPGANRRGLIRQTKFGGRSLGEIKRAAQGEARGLIEARMKGTRQHIPDDVSEVVAASIANRARDMQRNAAKATDLKNARGWMSPPTGGPTKRGVTPGPRVRRRGAGNKLSGVDQKALPDRSPVDRIEEPVRPKLGATVPAKRRQTDLPARQNVSPSTAMDRPREGTLSRIARKVTGQPSTPTKLADQLEETNKRLSDLHTIEEVAKGMRGGGSVMSDIGMVGIRGGMSAGLISNFQRMTNGGIPAPIAAMLTMGGMVGLSPSNISRAGIAGGRAARFSPLTANTVDALTGGDAEIFNYVADKLSGSEKHKTRRKKKDNKE